MSWLERRLAATLEGASHITDLEERLSELRERLSRVEALQEHLLKEYGDLQSRFEHLRMRSESKLNGS